MPRVSIGKMYACIKERVRESGVGGGRNQLFSIIKNATSKVELPQLSKSVWRMKSGLEPWGMHDFYQFNYWNLNLRQRQGGWDSTTFFWAEGVCESDHRCRTETRSECGPRLQSLRLVDGDTLSGDWARVIWWRLMNTDLLQDFINFCGQSISHRGE